MKPKPLILFLLSLSCCLPAIAQKNTFNWTDTVFVKGAIRQIRVEWGLDSPGIRTSSYDTLRIVIKFMKDNPFIKIEIGNHTDTQGLLKWNMILSQRRAQAIVNYLISQGIDSARVIPKGYGSTKPLPGLSPIDIAKMKTKQEKEAAYQADRRTEVKIIAPDSGNIFEWNDVKFMKYSRREIKIFYGLDSANIRVDSLSKRVIDSVAQFIKSHPYLKIGVYVHTDNLSGHSYDLSWGRARSVARLLLSRGADSNQIRARGWGGKRPEYSEQFLKQYYRSHQHGDDQFDYEHYPALTNRRTEIVILGMK